MGPGPTICEYLKRKCEDPNDDENYQAVILGKFDKLAEQLESIAKAFALIEAELMGLPSEDPQMKKLQDSVDATRQSVDRIGRKLKTSPASNLVCCWVKERWHYYNEHPEALKRDMRGKRVRAIDVWDTISDEARKRYRIADFAAFKAIMTANRQRACRLRNSRN